jgi:hypothetical protein
MAQTYNNLFEDALKSLIAEEIEHLATNIVAGGPVVDYPSYKFEIGRVAGLRLALELCDTANTQIAER